MHSRRFRTEALKRPPLYMTSRRLPTVRALAFASMSLPGFLEASSSDDESSADDRAALDRFLLFDMMASDAERFGKGAEVDEEPAAELDADLRFCGRVLAACMSRLAWARVADVRFRAFELLSLAPALLELLLD